MAKKRVVQKRVAKKRIGSRKWWCIGVLFYLGLFGLTVVQNFSESQERYYPYSGQRLIDRSYFGFQLIEYQRIFYAIPSYDQYFDLLRFNLGKYREGYQATSLQELKRLICSKKKEC